jgi:hypothetical protein
MDYWIADNYIFDKKEQSKLKGDINWKEEFELD